MTTETNYVLCNRGQTITIITFNYCYCEAQLLRYTIQDK